VPHSRWNDVAEDPLKDCGYTVLTRTRDKEVDAFVKRRKSLFVFLQGHPEYGSNTLQLEYRRDIGRYLRGERDAYPALPEGYFDRNTADLLQVLRDRALRDRSCALLADFPAALAEDRLANKWFPPAAQFYANWLAYICERKQSQAKRHLRYNNLYNAAAPELPASVDRDRLIHQQLQHPGDHIDL
jgi:homoserine O-succinyltransferase